MAVFRILRVRVELAKELEHALFQSEQLSCCSQCLSPLLPGLLLTSLSEPCVETTNYLPVCLSEPRVESVAYLSIGALFGTTCCVPVLLSLEDFSLLLTYLGLEVEYPVVYLPIRAVRRNNQSLTCLSEPLEGITSH